MDFELFLGRFHPLVVHIAIGLTLLAASLKELDRLFKVKLNRELTQMRIISGINEKTNNAVTNG